MCVQIHAHSQTHNHSHTRGFWAGRLHSAYLLEQCQVEGSEATKALEQILFPRKPDPVSLRWPSSENDSTRSQNHQECEIAVLLNLTFFWKSRKMTLRQLYQRKVAHKTKARKLQHSRTHLRIKSTQMVHHTTDSAALQLWPLCFRALVGLQVDVFITM